MDRKVFYNSIRPHVNLTTQNVQGMEKLLDYALMRYITIQWLAYIIATAWWESAQTMHPVKEAYWLSEDWRRKNLRYYPWYGRGLVQTTWERNYQAIAVAMGLPANFFTKDPNMLLLFEYALPALFVGMEKGIYTGKDVGDYIDDKDESDDLDYIEYRNARRVVNAMDKSDAIAKLALVFEQALKAAGFVGARGRTGQEVILPPPPVKQLPPEAIPEVTPPVAPEPERGWVRKFFDWLFGV